MTVKRNTFENAVADGSALTTANSDDGTAGDALDAVNTSLTGAVAVDTGLFIEGARSCIFTTGASGGRADVGWSFAGIREWYWRMFFYCPATWPAAVRGFAAYDVSNARLCNLQLAANRQFRLRDFAEAEQAASSVLFALDDWCRVEGRVVHGTTDGSFTLRVYTTDPFADEADFDDEIQFVNKNTGASNALTYMRFGHVTSGGTQANLTTSIDDISISDEGWIGSGAAPAGGGATNFVGMIPL